MKNDEVHELKRPESYLTCPLGHLWRDKWTALSGPLSGVAAERAGEWSQGTGVLRS